MRSLIWGILAAFWSLLHFGAGDHTGGAGAPRRRIARDNAHRPGLIVVSLSYPAGRDARVLAQEAVVGIGLSLRIANRSTTIGRARLSVTRQAPTEPHSRQARLELRPCSGNRNVDRFHAIVVKMKFVEMRGLYRSVRARSGTGARSIYLE